MHSLLETVLARISEHMMKPHDNVSKSVVSEAYFPGNSWVWRIKDNQLNISKVSSAVGWIIICKVLQILIGILCLTKPDIAQRAYCWIN